MADQNNSQGLRAADDAVTIRFGEKFTRSQKFASLFAEGMALVEETATYLDGVGRQESRLLSRMASLTYATESMRLTTRLMQLASWLLLQRAVKEGELTSEEARAEKHKVKLHEVFGKSQESVAYDELPETLKDLIERSLKLYNRIEAFDRMIYARGPLKASNENPIRNQLGQLQAAFCK